MRLLLPDAVGAKDLDVYRDAICRPRAAWAGLAYYRSMTRTSIQDDADRLRGKRSPLPPWSCGASATGPCAVT